ncbi:hypothetical protein M0812_17747 [Anaeramoeba flamelloides]|uniref:Uncharacterized protein n=1 Tax=Anaeramoeba flamelloides TaxID=1746091 RepID=A0AAV7Z5A9_9EUKA|nr:hypothetical protein M0812_17747 [Anaeramoeba flamelloides]
MFIDIYIYIYSDYRSIIILICQKTQIYYPPTSVPNFSLLCQDGSSCTLHHKERCNVATGYFCSRQLTSILGQGFSCTLYHKEWCTVSTGFIVYIYIYIYSDYGSSIFLMSKNQIIYPPTSVPKLSLLCQDGGFLLSKEMHCKLATMMVHMIAYDQATIKATITYPQKKTTNNKNNNNNNSNSNISTKNNNQQ